MEQPTMDRYGAVVEDDKPLYQLQGGGGVRDESTRGLVPEGDGLYRVDDDDNDDDDDDDDDSQDSSDEEFDMSMQELLYSSSSFYAIAKPVALTMMLSAWTVVHVNNEETREQGAQAMAAAYEMWHTDASKGSGATLAISLANALVMVSVVCAMTFVIVLLYHFRFMKCLIGYMIMCSCTLLGILGGNLLRTAMEIYSIPIDRITFFLIMYNFAVVGVGSIFFGEGIPKYVTQGYLIATSVILAWHLSYFDEWTTWTLLFMLACYDLCAVLTPCGPLRALVDLMSREDSPDMPGLLFEAELPPEAKRPGVPKPNNSAQTPRSETDTEATYRSMVNNRTDEPLAPPSNPTVDIPLAIAKVYNLPVVAIPQPSMQVMYPMRTSDPSIAAQPLLQSNDATISLPESPNAKQLRAIVTVKLPDHGGRLEHASKRGKKVYLERDRHGNPKRILWVDRQGKVYAEMRDDDDEGPERNSIRLGLGDFIFYSVMVSKAAQYSFATFCACLLVILAGLGGTLVLLSVYHHALPALPISIFMGVIIYLFTRFFVEPWIEAVLNQPYYV
jgi:presenilin 1